MSDNKQKLAAENERNLKRYFDTQTTIADLETKVGEKNSQMEKMVILLERNKEVAETLAN